MELSPVPRIWRFHLIYLVLAVVLSWAVAPVPPHRALLVVAGLAAGGIVLAGLRDQLWTHVLATAIGLGTPIVVFGRLQPLTTIVLFGLLIAGIFLLRRRLF